MEDSGVLRGTDRDLALLLRSRPRAPAAELAARLGVSERTVARKLTALREAGLVRFTVNPPPPRRGSLYAQVEITCEPGSAVAVARHLAGISDTFYVHLTTGSADVWVELYARDPADLLQKTTVDLVRANGIVSARTRVVLEVMMGANDWHPDHREPVPVRDRLRRPDTVEVTLDDLDRELYALLAKDCRAPVAHLAARLRVGEATVHRRLARMLDTGLVELRAEVPAAAFGYPVEALFTLSVDPTHLDTTVTALAAVPAVRALYLMAGPYNVLGYAVFPSIGSVRDLVGGVFSGLHGVQGSDVSLVLTSLKRMGTLTSGPTADAAHS